MTNKPQQRQQWILEELKKSPLLSFGEMFGRYSVKFSKTEKTFSKDWKQAKKQLETYQKKINEEVQKKEIENEVKAREDRILTKTQALEILSKISKGVGGKIGDKMIIPSHKDRISAIAQLSKMEGWDASNKIDITTEQPLFVIPKLDK